jgi:cellobiose phosphorylase
MITEDFCKKWRVLKLQLLTCLVLGRICLYDKLALRCDQNGLVSFQLYPPSGMSFFQKSNESHASPLLLWIVPEGYPKKAFTNFHNPVLKDDKCVSEPEEFKVVYKPWAIDYFIKEFGIECQTSIHALEDKPAIRISFSLKNSTDKTVKMKLYPVISPHCWSTVAAPWDVKHLYQTAEVLSCPETAFKIHTASPGGIADERACFFALTNIEGVCGKYVFQKDVFGKGTFNSPELVWGNTDSRTQEISKNTGEHNIIAIQSSIELEASQRYDFSLVLGALDNDHANDAIAKYSKYLNQEAQDAIASSSKAKLERTIDKRQIDTPDKALNRYVNEFVPLHLEWITRLDRGWGTGLRGTRDCSQDFTAMVEVDPKRTRKTILEILSYQRKDGSFLRQYDVRKNGDSHDERMYVDSGLWVWELIYEYLCYRLDFDLLEMPVRYLDTDEEETVFGHISRLFDYYMSSDNLGEHGLCKIYNGDWNDSINAAGLKGIGESVMVSLQFVTNIETFLHLIKFLRKNDYLTLDISCPDVECLENAKEKMSDSLRRHALNEKGFFNGVFTDAGQWVFSGHDPDGKTRINNAVNSFAIISGILDSRQMTTLVDHLKSLRTPYGYLLFHPALGETKIDCLGRMGTGDLPAGFGENATIYNHGSNGFLGRAAAVAGDGDMLYDTLRCLLPYDQEMHPVSISKTPPYAFVNHWRTAEHCNGAGGDCFFTGSISVGIRNIYAGMIGFRPDIEGIIIDPVIPTEWSGLSALSSANDCAYRITIENKSGEGKGVKKLLINGEEVLSRRVGHFRQVGFIEYELLGDKKGHQINIVL